MYNHEYTNKNRISRDTTSHKVLVGEQGKQKLHESLMRFYCYAREKLLPEEVEDYLSNNSAVGQATNAKETHHKLLQNVHMAWGTSKEASVLYAMKKRLTSLQNQQLRQSLEGTVMRETGFTPCQKGFGDIVTLWGEEIDILYTCGASPDALVECTAGESAPLAVCEAKSASPWRIWGAGKKGTSLVH